MCIIPIGVTQLKYYLRPGKITSTIMHQLDWCCMNATLNDLVEVKAGHPFRGSVPKVADGNAFALQMRDINPDQGIDWAGLTQTQIDGKKDPQWLRPGDVVFVARGGRNYAVCLREVPLPAVCSQYFFLLRVKSPQLLPEFLTWQINAMPAQRYLASNAEGSDQLSIRRGVLDGLPLAIPDLRKQHAIVALAEASIREKLLLERLTRNRQRMMDVLALNLHAAL